MVLYLKLLRDSKFGFLILLIVSAGAIFSFLNFAERNDGSPEKVEDLHYSKSEFQFSQDMLGENFDACLFAPSLFQNNEINRSEIVLSNLTRYDYLQLTEAEKNQRFPLVHLLIDFGTLMLTFLRTEIVLIEPSLLFCMLSPSHKALLLKRKFDVRPFANSQKVVTLGIRGEDTAFIQRKNVLRAIKSFGFDVVFVKEPTREWMKIESSSSISNSYSTHIFLKRGDWTIHLVVFHTRGNFLWHAALRHPSSKDIPPMDTLLFAETESAYDNFTFLSLGIWGEPLNFIYIPSNPQYFLFEMDTSKFIECNSTVVSTFLKGTQSPITRSPVSEENFNQRTVVALQELKSVFHPFLMHFWIWSGTMLGWHRQCDIIPYTGDVDFAAWASEVEDLPTILQIFRDNKHTYLKQLMGMVELGLEFYLSCHGLRVDVFFLYEESNGTWYAGHRPSKGYFFKYHHPNFTLCSAALLEHKVLVPCQTESVIAAEYGSEWMQPVSSWYYESSIKNRGPNIYWDKNLLSTVYPD